MTNFCESLACLSYLWQIDGGHDDMKNFYFRNMHQVDLLPWMSHEIFWILLLPSKVSRHCIYRLMSFGGPNLCSEWKDRKSVRSHPYVSVACSYQGNMSILAGRGHSTSVFPWLFLWTCLLHNRPSFCGNCRFYCYDHWVTMTSLHWNWIWELEQWTL